MGTQPSKKLKLDTQPSKKLKFTPSSVVNANVNPTIVVSDIQEVLSSDGDEVLATPLIPKASIIKFTKKVYFYKKNCI